jgi:hypothetical protein
MVGKHEPFLRKRREVVRVVAKDIAPSCDGPRVESDLFVLEERQIAKLNESRQLQADEPAEEHCQEEYAKVPSHDYIS